MRFIYSLFIYLYNFAINFAAFFNNRKAKLWVDGRKDVFNLISNFTKTNSKPIIWVHCASLGEFEQGRPFIEYVHKNMSNYSILLTFFSPSGYEIRKNFSQADFICYLPIDTQINAKRFIQIVNPEKVVFVKYEYWFNFINQIHKKQIPLYVISAILRPNQHFFKPYGFWFLKHLKYVNLFFTQNSTTTQLLAKNNIKQVIQCGDTRFDRVLKIASQQVEFPIINTFVANCKEKNVIVAGSTWTEDEVFLERLLKSNSNLKLIIVPHEIHSSNIKSIQQLFANHSVEIYSQTSEERLIDAKVLIIDTIGMLSKIYRYGKFAYIGGGFGAGIHNILEAVAYNIPVVFGPKYLKFDEAVSLINLKGAFSFSTQEQLNNIVNQLLNDNNFYNKTCDICSAYVNENIGATDVIVKNIFGTKNEKN